MVETKNENELLEGEISIEGLGDLFQEEFGGDIIPPTEEELEDKALLEEEKLKKAEKPSDDIIEEDEDEDEETEEELAAKALLEEEKIKKATNEDIKVTDTFSRTKSLIELGVIEDTRVSISEEDTEGTPLSEFKDISEEQLKKVIDLQQQKKLKELEDKYIPRESFNEDQLKIISMMQEGGDLKEIFTSEKEIKRPFEGMDLKDEQTAKKVVLWDLIKNKGNTQKDALVILAQKDKDFEIDTYVEGVVKHQNERYDTYMNSKSEELKVKKEEEAKKLSETRKNLSKVLQDSKIKENIARKIVDGVTKPISGNTLQVHEALKEVLKNPEENYEVLLHLLDRKSFNELYKIKQSSTQIQTVLSLIDAVPGQKAKKIKDAKKEDQKGEFEEEILNINLGSA